MTTDDLLQQGIAALKAGHKAEARNLLTQVVEQDQHNEMAWLWLSGAVEADDDKRTCLENVLAINPNNTAAKRGLAMIQQQQVGQAPQPAKGEPPQVRAQPRPAGPQPVLTTPEPTTAQPQPSQPAPPPSIEANRHLLEREIERLTKQGWQVVSQTETSAQVRKGKQWSRLGVLLFVVLPLLGGCLWYPLFGVALFGLILVIADYLLSKEQLKYITVEQLEQKADRRRASVLVLPNIPHTIWSLRSKRKKATRRWAGLDPMLVIGIGGVGLVLVCVVLAGIWWALDSGLLQLGSAVPGMPASTATPIPTWTPTPTPDVRAEVEEYLSEFCPLGGEKTALVKEDQLFWGDYDAYQFMDSPEYRDRVVAEYMNLTQRHQAVNDKIRDLNPPPVLWEHHRLIVRSFDYEERGRGYALEGLTEIDLGLLERGLDELDTAKGYLERSMGELDRVATEVGIGQPCP
jgi:hypothetical protein